MLGYLTAMLGKVHIHMTDIFWVVYVNKSVSLENMFPHVFPASRTSFHVV